MESDAQNKYLRCDFHSDSLYKRLNNTLGQPLAHFFSQKKNPHSSSSIGFKSADFHNTRKPGSLGGSPRTVSRLASHCQAAGSSLHPLEGRCSCVLCFHVALPEVPPLNQAQLPQLVCIQNELGMEHIRSQRPHGAIYTALDYFQNRRLCGMCKLRKSHSPMAVTGTYTTALAHSHFLVLFLASFSQFYCSERQMLCIFKATL